MVPFIWILLGMVGIVVAIILAHCIKERRSIRKALGSEEELKEVFKKTDHRRFVAYAQKLFYGTKISQEEKLTLCIVLILQYQGESNHLPAMEWLGRAREIKPRSDQVWTLRGITLRKMKCYEEALDCYGRAVIYNPKCVNAYASMGAAYQSQKEYDKAVDVLMKGLDIDPTHAVSYANLAAALSKRHEFGHAQQALDWAERYGYPNGNTVRSMMQDDWNRLSSRFAQ